MHTIRLRGPWQYEISDSPGAPARTDRASGNRTGRLKLPGSWSATVGEENAQGLLLRRRFGCPTGIEEGDRVWLVVEPGDRPAELRLNGSLLGRVRPGTPARHNISARLAHRNELVVLLPPLLHPSRSGQDQSATPGDRLLCDARLEIIHDPVGSIER